MLHSNFTNKSGMQKLRDIAFKQLNESQRPTEADEKAMKELKDKREARARAREEEFNPKPKPPRGKDEVNPGLDSKSKPRRTSESKPEPKPQSNKPLRGEVKINKDKSEKKYNTIGEDKMNLKEYFKERLMGEIINEAARTDYQRTHPIHADLEVHQGKRLKGLIDRFNIVPDAFQSKDALSRLINMGRERGMDLSAREASRIELGNRIARQRPGDPPIERNQIAIGPDLTVVSRDTPTPLYGVDEKGRQAAAARVAHDSAFRNKIKARKRFEDKFTV